MFRSLFNGIIKALVDTGTGRSPEWREVEHAFLRDHPSCAACGTKQHLQVHHMMPFHLDRSKELDPTNLIMLCMSVAECHLKIGHGDNWRAYNPNVLKDASDALSGTKTLTEVVARAKQNRVL